MIETLASDKENMLFSQHLMTISRILAERKITYSLVGGLAIQAILNGSISARRPNGTVHDFDALILGPNINAINEAVDELYQSRLNKKVCPEIGTEPVIFSNFPSMSKSLLTILSSVRIDNNGKYYLTFGRVNVEVPPETMELQERTLNGVPFMTFPAKTILYRYLIRGGIMKGKDDEKLKKLEQYILEHSDSEPDDKFYRPYLYFAEQMRENYPLSVKMYDTYWNVDHLLGDRISGSSGILYGFIKLFHP